MSNELERLTQIRDVLAVLLLSPDGEVLYERSAAGIPGGRALGGLGRALLDAVATVQEADLLFRERRVHLRQTGAGCLIVQMEPGAAASLVRMGCDAAASKLQVNGSRRGFLGRFSRRR